MCHKILTKYIDCLDLLSKIFVVDPSRRITLSAIQSHPWMNKGYEEPIRNYLPHRQPLEHIDMDIVNGMDGFGLGNPQEITEKLQKIISSAAYQTAALKIDQNYQKKASDDQSLASKPRWRRTLSTRKKTVMQDDFQSLPAMYDPLVSIYYLVKERRESDQRKKQLLEAEPNPLALSRSTSTLVVSRPTTNDAGSSITASTRGSSPPLSGVIPSLTRRRTFDTSKKLPDLPSLNKAPTQKQQREPNTPIPSVSSRSERVKSTTTLIRKKSLQAVRKLGIKLPGSVHQELSPRASDDNESATANASKKHSNTSIINSSSSSSTTTTNTANTTATDHAVTSTTKEPSSSVSATSVPTSPRKSNWLKLELSNNSATKQQQQQQQPQPQKRQSTNSASNRPSWRKLSISRKGTRHSMDHSTGNLPTQNDPMLAKPETSIKKSNSIISIKHRIDNGKYKIKAFFPKRN